MKTRVFVDGQEGTTGLRIHEYLAQRADVEVLRIDADKRKDAGERARLLNAADVAFLCLPDAAAKEAAALVTNPDTCLIDASTAHRTAPGWVFGLPELAPQQREALRATKRIANPGCHASAFILLLRPLVDAGLVPADLPLSATSITGFSGGGKKMIELAVGAPESPRPYGLTSRKHVPEMAQWRAGFAGFMPIVSRFTGLSVSVPLHLWKRPPGGADTALRTLAMGERFVRVMPLRIQPRWPRLLRRAPATTPPVDLRVRQQTPSDPDGAAHNPARASGRRFTMNVHLGVDEAWPAEPFGTRGRGGRSCGNAQPFRLSLASLFSLRALGRGSNSRPAAVAGPRQ
jgi:N-acetyl-gamma-glutamyl-phosphate reductase